MFTRLRKLKKKSSSNVRAFSDEYDEEDLPGTQRGLIPELNKETMHGEPVIG